jgi:hypothetical protein
LFLRVTSQSGRETARLSTYQNTNPTETVSVSLIRLPKMPRKRLRQAWRGSPAVGITLECGNFRLCVFIRTTEFLLIDTDLALVRYATFFDL